MILTTQAPVSWHVLYVANPSLFSLRMNMDFFTHLFIILQNSQATAYIAMDRFQVSLRKFYLGLH